MVDRALRDRVGSRRAGHVLALDRKEMAVVGDPDGTIGLAVDTGLTAVDDTDAIVAVVDVVGVVPPRDLSVG